jgi:predicted outer membrane repeat protein
LEALEDRWLPSTLTVWNNADCGPGTLRAAITAAQSGDTINFAPGLNGQTITLTSGELAINKSVTIAGPGASQLAISGNSSSYGTGSRVFDVTSQGATVTITGLTIENGYTTGDGGGIENRGNLTVSGVTFSDNVAGNDGGAIDNRANLTMIGCTVGGDSPLGPFGNTALNDGGAVENRGTALITASVFTNNQAFVGIIENRGSLTVQGSAFDDNVGLSGTLVNLGTLALSGSTFSENDMADIVNDGTATVSDQNVGYVLNSGVLSVTDQSQIGFIQNWGTVLITDQSVVQAIYNLGSVTVSSDSTVDNLIQF